MQLVDGNYLQQFVAPGLLQEFRNYNDAFIAVLKRAPQAAINTDGIRFNKLINNVDFLVNNDEDFTAKAMVGKKGIVPWDTFDTTPTSVTDAEARALAFDKRSEIRLKHFESFKIGVRDYCVQKLAPSQSTAFMPVLRTTGPADATGRRRLTVADMVTFNAALMDLGLDDPTGWHMNLSGLHQQDLILDKIGTANHRDMLVINPTTGLIDRFLQIKLWAQRQAPTYAANGVLKAQGAAAAPGDRTASIFYYTPNTVYHVESLKLLYSPENTDTKSKSPTSEFRIQSFGLCDKTQEHGFGALVDGNE